MTRDQAMLVITHLSTCVQKLNPDAYVIDGIQAKTIVEAAFILSHAGSPLSLLERLSEAYKHMKPHPYTTHGEATRTGFNQAILVVRKWMKEI